MWCSFNEWVIYQIRHVENISTIVYCMTQCDMLPAESMTAVSLCPVVSEHTETERPLQISPRHPQLPPGRCNYLAGHGALHNKNKSQIIPLWSCLKANNTWEGRKDETQWNSINSDLITIYLPWQRSLGIFCIFLTANEFNKIVNFIKFCGVQSQLHIQHPAALKTCFLEIVHYSPAENSP